MESWEEGFNFNQALASTAMRHKISSARKGAAAPARGAESKTKAEEKKYPGLLQLMHSIATDQVKNPTAPKIIRGIFAMHKYNLTLFRPEENSKITSMRSAEKEREDALQFCFGVKHYHTSLIYDAREFIKES